MFWTTKLRKYHICLFFISSCLSCLANRKHCTENHATQVTKKPKTKLPKYVMSRTLVPKHFVIWVIRKSCFIYYRILEKDGFDSWWFRFKPHQLSILYTNNSNVLHLLSWGRGTNDMFQSICIRCRNRAVRIPLHYVHLKSDIRCTWRI